MFVSESVQAVLGRVTDRGPDKAREFAPLAFASFDLHCILMPLPFA